MVIATPPNTMSPARRRASGAVAGADDDSALMNYLVETGRVAEPQNDEWRAELLELIAQGQRNLARTEGTFLMGERHVRLFRITRDDIAAAAGNESRHRSDVAEKDPPTQRIDPVALTVIPHDFTPRSSIPRGRMPTPADLEPLPSEVRPPRGPKVRPQPTTASRMVLGAASILLAAAVGTVLIAAWTPDSEPTTRTVAQTQTQPDTPVGPTTAPTANPTDVALARRPAAKYVAPAPKTTTQQSGPSNNARRATSQPKQRQRPAPKRRTVPNPIPGLPPIVLP